MTTSSGDFDLTMDELRVVTRYAVESAQEVLPVFEAAVPGDSRPRAAVEAAWEFVNGARRSNLQRVASLEAHRAAKEAGTETALLAARSAGDAAAAAYLHPIARATQVGHILRAAATAARVAELTAGDDPAVAELQIEQARQRATPALISVLCRYPSAPTGRNRVAQLMSALDAALRAPR
ncbi:putative immunity protein [Streptomyces sp. NPDC058646]|uniref:putative immunity protein n=1 Tax=Streptomyces sp. NPDC058646 TaxID=3346574 RepID=UPI0036575497